MPVSLETEWHPSTKLNVVGAALDFASVDPLPDGVTRDQIEEYCYTIEQLYGAYIEEVVAETTLSQREAQTWVLRNLVHEGADRLSFEAIGLYVWAIGRATEGDPLSRTIVSEYHDRAAAKIDAAEATVQRTQPPPYPDDIYEEPTMLWVGGEVAERLARRLGPEETYSDALERLLDDTVDDVPLVELVERFRDAGATFVGVRTVQPGWDRELPVSVHGGDEEAVDAAAVRVDDTPYPFGIEIRPADAGTGSFLTLFADGTDGESVTPAEGAARLRRALSAVEATLPELVDRARAADAAALAVADRPVGAGAHLIAVTNGGDDPLEHLDRLCLDDRTLDVTRTTTLSPAEYADREAVTPVWTADGADLGIERDLPSDPAARRERLPTAVLRTA